MKDDCRHMMRKLLRTLRGRWHRATGQFAVILCVAFTATACQSTRHDSKRAHEWGEKVHRNLEKGFLEGQVALLRVVPESEKPVAVVLAGRKVKDISFTDRTLREICEFLESETGTDFVYADHPAPEKHSGRLSGKNLLDALDQLARKLDICYFLDRPPGSPDQVRVVIRNLPYTRDMIGVDGIMSVPVSRDFLKRMGVVEDGKGGVVDCTSAFTLKGVPFPTDVNGHKSYARYVRKTRMLNLFNFDALNRELLSLVEKENLIRKRPDVGD